MKLSKGVVIHSDRLTVTEVKVKAKGLCKGSEKKQQFEVIRRVRSIAPRTDVRVLTEQQRMDCAAWEALREATLSVETLLCMIELLQHAVQLPSYARRQAPQLSVDRAIDVRKWLSDRHAVRQLLLQLAPWWSDAVAMMNLTRGQRKQWENMKPTERCVADLYLHQNYQGVVMDMRKLNIFNGGGAPLLQWIQGVSLRTLCDAAYHYESLLESHGQEFAQFIMVTVPTEHLVSWLEAGRAVRAQHLSDVMKGMARAKQNGHIGAGSAAVMLAMVSQFELAECKVCFVARLCHELKREPEQRALMAFDICERYYFKYQEHNWGASDGLMPTSVDTLVHAASCFHMENHMAARLVPQLMWVELSNSHFEEIQQALFQRKLSFETRRQWFGLFRYHYGERMKLVLERWDILLGVCLDTLERTPRKQRERMISFYEEVVLSKRFSREQVIYLIENLLSVWCDEKGQTHEANLSRLMLLVSRFKGSKLQQFCDLPESSLRRIDHAFRTDYRGDSIEDGVERLADEGVADFMLMGFRYQVRTTLSLMALVGASTESIAKEVAQAMIHHPLYQVSDEVAPAALITLGEVVESREGLSMPKAVNRILSGDQVRKEVVEKLSEQLTQIRTTILLQDAEDHLQRCVMQQMGVRGAELDLHTMTIGSSVDENRRSFRKVLRRYLQHGDSGVMLHPANVTWLCAKNRFWRPGVWIAGHEMVIQTKQYGSLTLRVEKSFEEVLKMGTRVGSCLSSGNMNAHSAIANAVDLNKQVVYAWDAQGRFIGRQLVAMNTHGQLACFQVYAVKAVCDELMQAFAAFDRDYAYRLGVAIATDYDASVKSVVCKDWYDDGIWTLPEPQAG